MILLFAVLRIFMEDNPYGIQNQNPLGIMELSVLVQASISLKLSAHVVAQDL
jgi:hypothetical protein